MSHTALMYLLVSVPDSIDLTAHSERPKGETGLNVLMLGFSFKGYFLFFFV